MPDFNANKQSTFCNAHLPLSPQYSIFTLNRDLCTWKDALRRQENHTQLLLPHLSSRSLPPQSPNFHSYITLKVDPTTLIDGFLGVGGRWSKKEKNQKWLRLLVTGWMVVLFTTKEKSKGRPGLEEKSRLIEKRVQDKVSRNNSVLGIWCGFKTYPHNLWYSSL